MAPSDPAEPFALAMFPLESVLLPGEELPLRIFEPRYAALVRDCLRSENPRFGAVLIARGREVGGGEERCDVGVVARIVECLDIGAGRYALRCLMSERIRVCDWLPDDPYPWATVRDWPDVPGDLVTDTQLQDIEDRMMALFERVAAAHGARVAARDEVLGHGTPDDIGKHLYALASRLPIGPADRYSVLSAPSAAARVAALREAVDSVAAMVDFHLST